MKGFETSFAGLFEESPGRPRISRIEIPMFQRDYAQGRGGAKVARIRAEFLEALRKAIVEGPPLTLDFVYGEVRDGLFEPLDGQQRLTTLFLIHWYLAARSGRLDERQGWKQFAYVTRPSARDFCAQLTRCTFPKSRGQLSAWIADQAWYRYPWNNDPTVQSMLTVLDAIHGCFADAAPVGAWERLVHLSAPAVTFHVLAEDELGEAEDLYIKMNSRGRPLTDFEALKAHLEHAIERVDVARAREFADKVDGAWSNMMWSYRGEDDAIDEGFLRYLEFVTSICEWRGERPQQGTIATRATATFGTARPDAPEDLTFLFGAFDTWVSEDVGPYFKSLFVATPGPVNADEPPRVVLYGEKDVNLFSACCRTFGVWRDKRRRTFTLQATLLLYGVLLHRLQGVGDPLPRLRVLRNLVEGSENEIREEQMPALLRAIERWMLEGQLNGGGAPAFSADQVADELRKARRLEVAPDFAAAIHHLEDHDLLRGRLGVFDLDAAEFGGRATSFHRLFEDRTRWGDVSGALLACGDYSRWKNRGTFQLGSSENPAPWRAIFTKATFDDGGHTRPALEGLLDAISRTAADVGSCLGAVQAGWLEDCERANRRDWRYYLVKYPVMRSRYSGLYAERDPQGFVLYMLKRQRLSGHHWDAYLLAVKDASGVTSGVREPIFASDEERSRGLELEASGVRLVSAANGFEVKVPSETEHSAAIAQICERHGAKGDLLAIPQGTSPDGLYDQGDRVQLAAALVRDLVAAGL